MNTNMKDDLIAKIQNQKITPYPKYYFLLKNYALMFLSVLNIILGAIAFCPIFLYFHRDRWDVMSQFKMTPIEYWIEAIPFIWIIFFLFFTYLAFQSFKKVHRNYRYSPFLMVISSLILSMSLGFFIHISGFSPTIEQIIPHIH